MVSTEWKIGILELEFGDVGFCGEEKTRVPRGKPTTNSTHFMVPSLGIKPGPYWCEASALTTMPSLLPRFGLVIIVIGVGIHVLSCTMNRI